MNKLIALAFFITILSCKKDTKRNIPVIEKPPVSAIDSVKINKLNLASSTNFVENWAEIVSFETELKRVLATNIQTEKDLALLKTLLEELKKTYPARFKKPAIEARVKVLETEILMLEQNLKDRVLNDIQGQLSRIQSIYNVFIGQIEALILKEKDYEKYH